MNLQWTVRFSFLLAFFSMYSSPLGARSDTVRPFVFKKLVQAQALIESDKRNDNDEAIRRLNALREMEAELTRFEQAQLWKFFAYYYSTSERYPDAIDAYEKLLSIEPLPKHMRTNSLLQIGQLYFMEADFSKALYYLEQWRELEQWRGPVGAKSKAGKTAEKNSEKALMLLAQTHYHLKNYREARDYAQYLIENARARQWKPKEAWYRLLYVIYIETGDVAAALHTVKMLTRLFSKREYWLQLAYLHGQQNNEQEQLAVLDAAYLQGFLKDEAELLSLAQLYMNKGLPFKTAQVLEQGITEGLVEKNSKNMMQLAKAWRRAKHMDKAMVRFEQAASLSDDWTVHEQLAVMYYHRGNYTRSIHFCQEAIKWGKQQTLGRTFLVLGIALFEESRLHQAAQALTQATTFADTRQNAGAWLRYVRQQMALQETGLDASPKQ